MLWFFDRWVLGMVGLRLFSSMVEFSAALLMLKLNRVDQALRVNAVLAMIGPTVMLAVTALGIAGLAGHVAPQRMLAIILGAGLIFWGVRH